MHLPEGAARIGRAEVVEGVPEPVLEIDARLGAERCAVDDRSRAVRRLGGRVAGRCGESVDRVAQALIESEVGPSRRKRPADLLPPSRGLLRDVRVREEPVDRHWREALVGVEHEDREVPGEKRRQRRSRGCGGTRPRHDDEPDQQSQGDQAHAPSMRSRRPVR